MKNMKKLWAALLALAMTFSLAACGGTSDEDAATDDQPTGEEVSGDTAPESDVAYIQDKGTLVVGITYFAPMDYKEEGSDEWIHAVVGMGFVEIVNNRVTLLVETAEKPEEIDVRRAEEAKQRAEERLRQKQSIHEYYHSRAALARAMARLKATSGK